MKNLTVYCRVENLKFHFSSTRCLLWVSNRDNRRLWPWLLRDRKCLATRQFGTVRFHSDCSSAGRLFWLLGNVTTGDAIRLRVTANPTINQSRQILCCRDVDVYYKQINFELQNTCVWTKSRAWLNLIPYLSVKLEVYEF